jgi:hypothetical protein
MKSAFLVCIGVMLGLIVSGFADNAHGPFACAASKCDLTNGRLTLVDRPSPGVRLFAQVRNDGVLNASSPGVKASKFSDHIGTYRIDFGQNISHCAANVTLGALPYFGTPGASTTRMIGFAVVDMFAPGFTFPKGYPSGDTAEVEMRGANGARLDAPFYIVVSC